MPILFLITLLSSCSAAQKTDISVYPQLGHSNIVSAAFYSSDGRYIVSSSWDMSVKLWDTASGREMATFLGHTDRVNYASISRDNSLIASASQDGSVRIWDTKTGKEKFRIEEKAYSVVFGQDDKTILTIRADGINQWNTKTGKLVGTFNEDTAENIFPDAFKSGDTIIVSGNGEIKLLNIKTGFFKTNYISPSLLSSMATSKDGSLLAHGTWNGAVNISENGSEKSADFFAHNAVITSLAFSGDNRYLATASNDLKIHLWDLDSLFYSHNAEVHPIKTFDGHTQNNISVYFSPDNRYIISTSLDKIIKIWDTVTGEETTLGGHSVPPDLSIISRDSSYIASLDRAGSLKIWNAKTGVFIESFDYIDKISSMVFSEDTESLITVSPEGNVASLNIKTGRNNQISQYGDISSALVRSFDPEGRRIVSVLWNGTIEIWDYAGGETINFEHGEEGLIIAAGLDVEGKRLAAGFINGKLRITDLESEKVLLSIQYESPVNAVKFSMDSRLLACGLRDGTVHLLDVLTGKEIIPVMRHLFGVSSVSFSDDGRKIISSAADNTTVLWNAGTGEKIASFISFSDNEWVTITGDGYYNASPRGDERLNVRIGSEIYGMDQFSAVFFQAEVVNARLEGLPDPAFVTEAENRILAPPAIQINAPLESDTGRTEIGVSIKDHFRQLNTVQIVINSRLLGAKELEFIKTNANISVENAVIVIKESTNELEFTIPVNLDAGSNRVQVIATNRESNQSTAGAEGRKSVYTVNTSEAAPPSSDAWVLAIGSNSSLTGRVEENLQYAVNDAMGILSLFESQQGKRYRNVHTRLIADGEAIAPTRENIINSIREFFGKANSNDVLILFLSGHGDYREGSGYYFLPQAVTLNDIGLLADMPGRKIIFIDSCYSGVVDDKRLAGNLKNQSTAIITSSQRDKRSFESEKLAHGFFTEALITGIGGEAAVNNEVRLHNLIDYVSNKVKWDTGGKQNPYDYVPEGFWGFVLADLN